MTLKVKICGLTHGDHVKSAIENKANYLGFIHFGKSPRHLELSAIKTLINHAHGLSSKIKCVCVVVDPSDDLLREIDTMVRPDFIQLHGHESLERVDHIANTYNTPLIKAIGVSSPEDIEAAYVYEPLVAHLLFDAKPMQNANLPGGLGLSFDWGLMANNSCQKAWFLAGGLNAENINEALLTTKAPMVDVSSGVESIVGLKDAALIDKFMRAVLSV